MRFSRKRGLVAALVAVGLATSALAIDANPIEAGRPGRVNCRGRNDTRRELLRCVKVDAVLNHLRAFQRIADRILFSVCATPSVFAIVSSATAFGIATTPSRSPSR